MPVAAALERMEGPLCVTARRTGRRCSVRQYVSEGPCATLSEVDAKDSIVCLTSPCPFATGNGAETMIYPEGNITLLDAHLFDPAQLA
jgi:hypothetical protein